MQLSPEQKTALKLFKEGKNIFITGPGGTGKTELIKHLVEDAKLRKKNIQVCALTGCASVLLGCGAKTVHSWANIGLASGDSERIIERISKSKHKKKAWLDVDILIIDEVSMMSVKLLEILDELGKKIRKQNTLPFGGIQIVLSGDFYQLPPVGDKDEPDTCKFCFESSKWNLIINEIVCLKTMFRQTDAVYAKVLNQIRIGKLYKSSFNILQNCIGKSSKELLRPTILLPRRRDVDNINASELAKLDTETKIFNWNIEGNPQNSIKNAKDVEKSIEIRFLKSGMMVDEKLVLKVGAQVMCVANIDMEGPYPIVNGSQGIVVEFVKDLPLVQFRDGQKRIIGKHRWSSETIESVGVQQIPLIHAWAITIHKAQGVTLELAQIDAGSNIFECGQTYVALSRVKSLEGLYLTALNPGKIKVNKKVQEFYSNLNHKVSQMQA